MKRRWRIGLAGVAVAGCCAWLLGGCGRSAEGTVEAKAEKGDAEAQYVVAKSYMSGAMRDEEKAFGWMLRAADRAHHVAQYHLASMCLEGRGAVKDTEQALKYAQRAAEAGVRALLDSVRRLAQAGRFGLSHRERQILSLVREGLLNKEIADRLKLSKSTIHAHLARIYKKLRTHKRGDAVLKFVRGGRVPVA